MNKNKSDYKVISKLFFGLLPYQILLLIINSVNAIVDSLVASNFIGKDAMSAIGFYAPFNHLLFALSIMLVSGSQLLVGKAMGKHQMQSVQRCFSTTLVLAAILSAAATVLLVGGAAADLTRFFVANEAERPAINWYIIGQSLGIPALVLGQQFFSFLSLENQTRRTMLASIVCIAVNVATKGLFVIVLHGGTFGLGLSSTVSMFAFLAVMAQYYLAGKSDMKFQAGLFSWKDSLHIIKTGYSGALSRFAEMFRCLIVNMLILRCVGSVGLSAFAAVNSVMGIFWPLPFGMVAVTRMLLGIYIGEEDRKSVSDTMKVMLLQGGLLQCILTVVLMLLARPFTLMFYRDLSDPVFGMTLAGFRLLPLCMPLAVASLAFACFGQAFDKKYLSVLLPIMDGAVSVTVFSLFMIPAWGMTGLYIANILNGFVCLGVVVFFAFRLSGHMPKNIDDLLLLPDSFGAVEKERMDIEVREMPEVLEVSRQVISFCESRSVDRRRASFAGLAMEEMAGNIVDHGFTKDSKEHALDIRVVHKGDDVILRLRDNCVAFDPLERVKILDGKDEAANIGIRLVNGIAKDVQYQNLLGLNVLTIRI